MNSGEMAQELSQISFINHYNFSHFYSNVTHRQNLISATTTLPTILKIPFNIFFSIYYLTYKKLFLSLLDRSIHFNLIPLRRRNNNKGIFIKNCNLIPHFKYNIVNCSITCHFTSIIDKPNNRHIYFTIFVVFFNI